MAGVSKDFLRFLEANFYGDWLKVSPPDVAEDVVTAIKMKYAREYQIWMEIPEWVKSRFRDKLPKDVLNGNETVQHFVDEETKKAEAEKKEASEIVDYSVSLLALGYAVDTVTSMAENRALREDLLRQNGGKPISLKWHPELFIKWLESREKDIAAISKDWKTRQPEKHMLHLAKALSREKRRLRRLRSPEDIAASEAKIKKLEDKLKAASKVFNSRAVKMNMVDYLRGRPQQAALRHMVPEVRKVFSDLLEKQGIRISPVKSMESMNHTLESRESFTKDLQEALNKIEQQSKSASGVGLLAKALQGKAKKGKGKNTNKKVPKKQSAKTTLTLKKVPTLEII